jgi:hypothetical protein
MDGCYGRFMDGRKAERKRMSKLEGKTALITAHLRLSRLSSQGRFQTGSLLFLGQEFVREKSRLYSILHSA